MLGAVLVSSYECTYICAGGSVEDLTPGWLLECIPRSKDWRRRDNLDGATNPASVYYTDGFASVSVNRDTISNLEGKRVPTLAEADRVSIPDVRNAFLNFGSVLFAVTPEPTNVMPISTLVLAWGHDRLLQRRDLCWAMRRVFTLPARRQRQGDFVSDFFDSIMPPCLWLWWDAFNIVAIVVLILFSRLSAGPS